MVRGRPRTTAADSATSRYRGADGRWHARVTVGRRLDGERDRRHISRATRREVDAAIRDLENARDSGQQPCARVLEQDLVDVVDQEIRIAARRYHYG